MQRILTAEESQYYEAGGWDQWHLEETLAEEYERLGTTEPVIVTLDTGEIVLTLMRDP